MITIRTATALAGFIFISILQAQAAPHHPSPIPALPRKGALFESAGRVSLHVGEPCASQIMFDFHGRANLIAMAAPKRETAVLTEAARRREKVRISGVWRRGTHPGCAFVEVTRVVVEKKFLGIF